ncbi:MAG: cupin domain-containing protein [Thermoplasmata archaeon]|jgi:mannose-6-phosphate isomerase-like protein (cupin superfamily)|nr:cupin domain-containing protein [Thermoplasmata archaeon]
MEPIIAEVAERVRAMREMCDISVEEMAEVVGKTPEEYRVYESGQMDFSFTFLYKIAKRCGIDMVELLTGEKPHLAECTYVKAGHGLPIKRRRGFEYQHLGYTMKNRLSETFLVIAPYIEGDNDENVHMSTHAGNEFDYVLEGTMRFVLDGNYYDLEPGDSVYYNSGLPHGIYATSKEGCKFIASVMKERAQ